MKFINKDKLRVALATTADGPLKGGNNYDDFILNAIDERTDKDGQTELEEVHSDFSYILSGYKNGFSEGYIFKELLKAGT